ncbi:DUF802 domain-containing protein [Trinickia sp. LjRoot230]|uniref:DUF802 domain-containing protein n=1 Tax=Trinickia sp. LjRoot230 TaxID=3342288 RepID=UPI003ECCA7CC
MSRTPLNLLVFFSGVAALCWIGIGYVGSNALALAVTLLIGVCYLTGALELKRYQEATASLKRAAATLSEPPPALGIWLEQIHPSLRNAVRQRVESERAALPGPVLTSYLVGLLVLLGMLGTLLGMVLTLRGTGAALENATDLQAIRASLAAPVKGLGFAFGTSIAGVATSAMLGLLSALCRRERVEAVHLLDAKIATSLRIHSQVHQRETSLALLQHQAATMPALVDRLQMLMATIERQHLALNEQQLANQDAFHGKTAAAYTDLAASVAQSLKESVSENARALGSALQPVVHATMAGLARETATLHDTLTQSAQRQFDAMSSNFNASTATVTHTWTEALAEHRRTSEALTGQLSASLDQFVSVFAQRATSLIDEVAKRNEQARVAATQTFEQLASSLVRTLDQAHAQRQADAAVQDDERLAAWTNALDAMAASLTEAWATAGEHTASRQQDICDKLAQTSHDISAQTQAHARETIAEIATLVQAASEAPKAAAEVIAELRQKLSDSMARDTALLNERNRLLETLETLLNAVNHASTEQRSAISALVSTSAELLDRVGRQFSDKVELETERLGAATAQLTASTVEVSSVGDAFGLAVQLFGESNDKLMAHLQRIEAALDKSLARSDEQLAYYVAQAREAIDLSIRSQKQIVEDLQQLAGQRESAGANAA